MRHAKVDQACLFPAGHDLDGKTKGGLGLGEKLAGILRHAQGVGAHGAYGLWWETAQAFAEPTQRLQRPLLGGFVEPLLGSDAGREPDRLPQGVKRIDLIVYDARDLEPEGVRTQVDRCDSGKLCHQPGAQNMGAARPGLTP